MEYVHSFIHDFLPSIKEVLVWFAIVGTICVGFAVRVSNK